MSPGILPCVRALDRECFRAHPEFARRALAYRLLHLLIPPDIARLLPKRLRDPLVAPGVEVPLDAVFPPGTVLVPGCSFPAGWKPEDEPPECAKSAPLPTLAMQAAGANPSTFLSPGEPGTGQVHPPPGPAPGPAAGSGTYTSAALEDDGFWYTNFFDNDNTRNWIGEYYDRLYHNWYTFRALGVSAGQTIVTAKCTFTPTGTSSRTGDYVEISANVNPNPTNPANYTDAAGMTSTDNKVVWTYGAWTIHTPVDTAEIKTLIQEVVDHANWTVDSNLMIIVKTTDLDSERRGIHTYDNIQSDAYRPQLYIEWE